MDTQVKAIKYPVLLIFLNILTCICGYRWQRPPSCSASCNGERTKAYQNITALNEASLQFSVLDICRLDLSGNKIQEIQNDSFYSNSSGTRVLSFYALEELDLSNNRIYNIEVGAFKEMNNLIYLDLSGNYLVELRSEWFLNTGCLEVLNASGNEIISIENGVFSDNVYRLKHVNLSRNHLQSFEPWPYLPGSLLTFDLSYNNITNFTNEINWKYDLKEPYDTMVDLRHNKIAEWSDFYIKQYQLHDPTSNAAADFFTMNLDLRENEIFCDCNLHLLVRSVRTSYYRFGDERTKKYFEAKCHAPSKLKGLQIFNDNDILDDLNCDLKIDCPPGCVCTGKPEANVTLINCTNAGSTTLPNKLPENIYKSIHLLLDNNRIPLFQNRDYLSEIENLTMKRNYLRYIDDVAMSNMTKLTSLDVSNNNLQFLPKSVQFKLPFEKIQLQGNPLVCECNMTWMADWIGLSLIGTTQRDIQCTHKGEAQYKVIDVTENMLNCTYGIVIGLAVTFGIFFIVAVIAAIWAKRCPYETKVLLYRFLRVHPRDKYIVDRQYGINDDLYVSFDDTNIHIRQWVLKELTKKLEKQKPCYNVFIPYRDLMGRAGEDKAGVIMDQMEKSKRVVIILSEGCEDNEWHSFECQRAELVDFNPGRIIFVQYHPEVEQLMDKEPWKSRVKGRKVLKRGETSREKKWFWYKLKYELPVK